MRVALVNPPALPAYGRYRAAAKAAAQPQVQLGLLYVAGALLEAGHDVTVLDADADGLSVPQLVSAIREGSPDVVGIGAATTLVAVRRDHMSRRAVLPATARHAVQSHQSRTKSGVGQQLGLPTERPPSGGRRVGSIP